MLARGLRSLVVVTLGCLALSGCLGPRLCTLIGAEDGVIVELKVTGGTLPPGNYAMIARVDSAEVRVDEVLQSTGVASTTEPTGNAVVDGKHLVLDGTVFAQTGRMQINFREGGAPAEVTVELWRESDMLAQETYKPRYSEVSPNGEGCEPHVQQAHETLQVPAPSP